MWISNTAATTMMLPIVEIVLLELEAVSVIPTSKCLILCHQILFQIDFIYFLSFNFQQGLGDMFIREENNCEESIESCVIVSSIFQSSSLIDVN